MSFWGFEFLLSRREIFERPEGEILKFLVVIYLLFCFV